VGKDRLAEKIILYIVGQAKYNDVIKACIWEMSDEMLYGRPFFCKRILSCAGIIGRGYGNVQYGRHNSS